MVRKTVVTEASRGGDFSEETRTQIVLSMPSNIFNTCEDMANFFQGAVCGEVNRIHKEMIELEVTGRICDFMVPDRCNG